MDDLVELTAIRRYYKIYKDDKYVSQHTTEREAAQNSTNLCFANPESSITYFHDYEVKVMLTNAGVTIAGTSGAPTNLPPVIVSTPSPSFVEGTADTYDTTQDWTDDGLSTVITSLTNTLPNGLSYDGVTHILTYDGIGIPSVSQHQLQVDDQVNPIVTSSIFNISINAVGASPWTANTPTYLPAVPGGAGFGFNQSAGSGRHLGTTRTRVIFIKNLSDSGVLSMPNAFEGYGNVPRFIVPSISGMVDVGQSNRTNVVSDYATYVGQCAPGEGLHITGRGVFLGVSPPGTSNHVLLMHLSVFLQRFDSPSAEDGLSLGGFEGQINQVAMNCAFFWTNDESAQITKHNGTIAPSGIALYQTHLAEALADGNHDEGLNHNLGPLYVHSTDITTARCFFAHLRGRTPNSGADNSDIVNNLIYNADEQIVIHNQGTTTPITDSNIRGIFSVPGPDSSRQLIKIASNVSGSSRVYETNNDEFGLARSIVDNQSGITLELELLPDAASPGYNETPYDGSTISDALAYVDLFNRFTGVRPAIRITAHQRSFDECINAINGVTPLGNWPQTEVDRGGIPVISEESIDHEASGVHGGDPIPAGTNRTVFSDGYEADFSTVLSGKYTGYSELEAWCFRRNDDVSNVGWDL